VVEDRSSSGAVGPDEPAIALAIAPARRRISWALGLLVLTFGLLVAQRYYYLSHFGFVYTDGDQTAFWDQANDVAHGIFREPCLYGQSYNIPVEAWLAVPLLWVGVPAYVALPIVASALGVLPFVVLALLAYRRGQRWIASCVLLIPLVLPIQYTVVSSLPRGFINGLAVATAGVACWVFGRSRRAFFFGAFFAVLGVAVNPNCLIVLIAAGVFALLIHGRSAAFYLFSVLGAVAALPVPIFVWLFYRYHPECDAYHPKLAVAFTWRLLNNSIFVPGQSGLTLNRPALGLFFADLVPILHDGRFIFVIGSGLVVLLLLVFRIRAAIAVLIAWVFALLCLGIDRIHMASVNVFYPGARMFLALPVVIAIGLIWFDAGVQERCKRVRFAAPLVRTVMVVGLLGVACFSFFGERKLLDWPSPLVMPFIVPPVNSVEQLMADSRALTDACQKYDADLVLIGQNYLTCMNQAGPILSGKAFETLSPFFERRTYRIAEERKRLHRRVIVYLPTTLQVFFAARRGLNGRVISDSPRILLIETAPPGISGLNIALDVGILYREKF
jgi:hypothetical protein